MDWLCLFCPFSSTLIPRDRLQRMLNIFHANLKIFSAAVLIDPEDLEINLEGSGQIRSFALNKTHLKLWERQNGKIPYGSFVILRSGWSQFYDFRDKFFGFFADEERQVFPGKRHSVWKYLKKSHFPKKDWIFQGKIGLKLCRIIAFFGAKIQTNDTCSVIFKHCVRYRNAMSRTWDLIYVTQPVNSFLIHTHGRN